MKKLGKILIISVMIFLSGTGFVFSLTEMPDLGELQKATDIFAEEVAKALPFNSTIGLNWSDAYIGQLIDLPPHFGVGLTIGTTFINIDAMNDLLVLFGTDLGDVNLGFPLPAYTFDARIGGIILPFDAGFKIGYIPSNIPLLNNFGIDLDYLLVGADIRYSLLPKKIPLVKLSAGLGVNHLRGGIATSLNSSPQKFSFEDPDGGADYILNIPNPTIGLRWKTTCFELKTQASIKLLIFTPYAGFGLSYAKSQAGFELDSKVNVKQGEDDVDLDTVKDLMSAFGLDNISSTGFDSMYDNPAWNLRMFTGFSLNMAVIKLDITAMYNFFSSSLGGSVGLRFQL